MGRIIAVANQKGGVAKTTTVHALGTAWADRGKKVLLVDLDPQASLTWAAGIDPDAIETSLHDVLLKRNKAADVIIETDFAPLPERPGRGKGTTATSGPVKTGPAKGGLLHLLPSTIDLAGAELHLLTKTGREYGLRKALAKVADRYDVVLIDCPPSLGILTINGLTAAQQVVIPLQCESLGQRGVGQLLETIEDVRDYTNPDLKVLGVIATLFDARTRLANEVVASVKETFDLDVLEPPVPKSVKVAEAPGHGQSVLHYAPNSKSAVAYRALAAKLDR